jgi:hypothetical protein
MPIGQEIIDAYIMMQTGERVGVPSKPDQQQIDAEFARLASMRVDPKTISSFRTLPSNVAAVMEKYKDYPIH